MRFASRNENGATAVEYGLLVTLLAGVIIVSVQALGLTTQDAFNSYCTAMAAAGRPC